MLIFEEDYLLNEGFISMIKHFQHKYFEKITDTFRKTEFRSVAYIYAKFNTLRVVVCLQHDCVNMYMNKLDFLTWSIYMYMN